jgi:antitoxin component YwqK of YwqJK toxin-antitoxin module
MHFGMKKLVLGCLLLGLAACGTDENATVESPDTVRTECDCEELYQVEAYNKFHLGSSEMPFSGTCTLKHADKTLAEERIFVDGKIEGHIKRWHENGQLASEAFFVNNRQDGEFKQWDENGKMTYRGSYKNGKMIEQLPLED